MRTAIQIGSLKENRSWGVCAEKTPEVSRVLVSLARRESYLQMSFTETQIGEFIEALTVAKAALVGDVP